MNRTLSRTLGVIMALLSRTFDAILALLVLVLGFPLVFLPCMCIHKMLYGGPTFFRQEREGYKGKEIVVYKIRTYDVDGINVLDGDFAEFLRCSRIDEFPQFINIIFGNLIWGAMAFVGPRPLKLDEAAEEAKRFPGRTSVRPGMTSTVVTRMGIKDKQYIERWRGFWFDKKVLFIYTPRAIFLKETDKAFVAEALPAMEDSLSTS